MERSSKQFFSLRSGFGGIAASFIPRHKFTKVIVQICAVTCLKLSAFENDLFISFAAR